MAMAALTRRRYPERQDCWHAAKAFIEMGDTGQATYFGPTNTLPGWQQIDLQIDPIAKILIGETGRIVRCPPTGASSGTTRGNQRGGYWPTQIG
jgi:hypothetical protein